MRIQLKNLSSIRVSLRSLKTRVITLAFMFPLLLAAFVPGSASAATCSSPGPIYSHVVTGVLVNNEDVQNGAVALVLDGNPTNYCPVGVGNGWYEVVQYGTNWCLSEDKDAFGPNEDIVTVQTCNDYTWQKWAVVKISNADGGLYTFQEAYDREYMTYNYFSNTYVWLSPRNGSTDQYWCGTPCV